MTEYAVAPKNPTNVQVLNAADIQIGAVTISDIAGNTDAFSRMRVSDPYTVFDSTFRYGLATRRFYQTTANGGGIAFDPNKASAVLSTAAQSNSSAIMQSKAYNRYIPGKSQFIVMTQCVGAGVSGVKKRCGYFDANDGIFFEQNGVTDLAFTRRTSTSGSPSDNRVDQLNWNLDPLNGTGTSGITLDVTKSQILVIDFQWLGVGRVRVGFDIDGHIVYAHEFLNANNVVGVYMKTGDLPLRWEIAGNGIASMDAHCGTVISEGGVEHDQGYQWGQYSGSISVASGTRTHGLSIRPAATINSITNRVGIKPTHIEVLVTGNNPVLVELIHNSTFTATPTFTAVDATYSVAEYSAGTSASIATAGQVISAWFVAASATARGTESQDIVSRLPITLDPAGANPIPISVVLTGLGNTTTAYVAINWTELR